MKNSCVSLFCRFLIIASVFAFVLVLYKLTLDARSLYFLFLILLVYTIPVYDTIVTEQFRDGSKVTVREVMPKLNSGNIDSEVCGNKNEEENNNHNDDPFG